MKQFVFDRFINEVLTRYEGWSYYELSTVPIMAEVAAAEVASTLVATSKHEDVVGDWKKETVLGTGGFGMVILWKNIVTNERIALKQIRWANDPMLTPKHYQRWTQEVDIMRRLSHPNVVSAVNVPDVLNVATSDVDLPPLLAMEYCTGGDLRKVLARPENCCGISEIELRTLLQHVLSALRYLHSLRIIHRDLKPENIVLQEIDGKIEYKLIDLGYAKELDQGSLCTSFVGTLQYLAPELFLSQKYTSTVDYWSFGLVAHECITGARPFLPNLSPAQWIPHVMKKKSEHICAGLGSDGSVVFSSELVPENHISGPLKTYMERWLAVMLEWDPQNRGCVLINGQKEVIAFSMLESVLSKKILTVFCVHSCQYFWYEVNETTTMGQVVQWVCTNVNKPKNNLLFLLQQGSTCDVRKTVLQCWPTHDEDECVLYAFSRDTSVISHPSSQLPPLVEKMLRENKPSTIYEEQRRMWAHSLFFISQERSVYRRLLQAHKVIMLHLLSKNSNVYNITVKMVRELNRLKAKLELFEESLQYDVQKYESQAQQGGITSDIMFKNWLCNQDISRKILQLQERVLELEGKATVANTKTIELQRSPYARNRIPTVLEEMYEKALIAFDNLKKRPKEHRQTSFENTEMIRILVTCMKLRDRILHDIHLHIKRLMDCFEDVGKLMEPLEAMLSEICDHDKQLETVQRERQADIWKLMENLCKKIRAIRVATHRQSNSNLFDESSLGATSGAFRSSSSLENVPTTRSSFSLSSAPESPYSERINGASHFTLSSFYNKCVQDTPSLTNENVLLRTQLQRVQRTMQQFRRNSVTSKNNSLDWDFLNQHPKT